MEDRCKYALLLERGGEAIAMAGAKYLYLMGNYGEPWTTGVRNACLALEKLDFSKERQVERQIAKKQAPKLVASVLRLYRHC